MIRWHFLPLIMSVSTLASLPLAAAAEEPTAAGTLRLVSGHHDAVELLSWEEDDTLTFRAPEGQVLRHELPEVVRFGRGSAARNGQGLLLVDGSYLVGRVMRITDTDCVVSGRYIRASVPRPLVRAVLMTAPPIDGLQDEMFGVAFAATGSDDVVIGVDGDRTTGVLQSESPQEAVVWERGDEAVPMVQKGRMAKLAASRIRAVIFSPLLTPLHSADAEAATVGLADGTRLQVRPRNEREADSPAVVRSVEGDGEAVRWQLVCGLDVGISQRRWSAATITYISSGQLALATMTARRLSAEPPLRLRVQPKFEQARILDATGSDRPGADGVVVQGRWYANAVAMPSASQAVYRGVASGGHLRADVAIRDREAPDAETGSVRFRVFVAGEGGRLREVWKSETIRGGQGLVAVDVPLPPTPAVVLAVDPADRGRAGDSAVWIDAVVSDR